MLIGSVLIGSVLIDSVLIDSVSIGKMATKRAGDIEAFQVNQRRK